MCVDAVAQPNGLLFHNSHFQDTTGCFYGSLRHSLIYLKGRLHSCNFLPFTPANCGAELKGEAETFGPKPSVSLLFSAQTSCHRSMRKKEISIVRTSCVEHSTSMLMCNKWEFLCTQQLFSTNLKLLFLEQLSKTLQKVAQWDRQKWSLTCGVVNVCSVLWCRILRRWGAPLKRKGDETRTTTEPTTERRQDHASL